MKVFVIGSGGREHALVWALARSPHVKQIYSATANAGILKQTTPAGVSAGDINSIVEFAALEKIGKTPEDVDLWEINEAFASVTLNSMRMLGVDEDKVNVNGGAVALGHPIGASGARIVGTLVNELRRRGGGLGVAAICSGGGQGDAVVVEVPGE